jgi:hypothetical protein
MLFLYLVILFISIIFVFTYFIGLINVINQTAPFVPTGKKEISVIKEELNKHKVKSLIDLGSGDGNVLITVASSEIYVTGYENNLFLYLFSLIRKKVSKNDKYINIKFGSLFDANLHNYDAIFIYGISGMMQRTQAKILTEAKKGAIVISNTFVFSNLTKMYKKGNVNFYLVSLCKSDDYSRPHLSARVPYST